MGTSFTFIAVLTAVVVTFVLSGAAIVYLYKPIYDPDQCVLSTNSTHTLIHNSQISNMSTPTQSPSLTPHLSTCPPCPSNSSFPLSACPTCPPTTCPSAPPTSSPPTPCPTPSRPSSAYQPDGILISAYLGEKGDQQRENYHFPKDSFEYISYYYNSVKLFGLKTVIFHDNAMSDDFAKKYTTENITFIKQNLKDPAFVDWGNYHLKFEFALRYLKANPHQYAMITDLSDVVFLGNVFKWMDATTDSFDLYIGSEPNTDSAWGWLYGQMMGCWKDEKAAIQKGDHFYNAGIIGGKYDHMITLLEVFHEAFSKDPSNVCDMATLFKYLYKDNKKSRVMTGLPLHKEFRKGNSDPNFAFIKHK